MTITSTTRRTGVLALLVAGLFASSYARTNGQAQPSVAFTHVDVIDGTGAALKRNQNVVTSSGRITAIGDADRTPVPSGARVVDASGKYLIPGLWDAHVHSRPEGVDHLRLFIANGVTGFRDMGSHWEHFEVIKQWRREIAAGERIGPRIVTAGPLVDGPGSQWWHAQIASSPNEGRDVVRRLRREGADFVKFYENLSRETFFAIVDEAKQQGLPTAGHVPFVMSVGEVAETGPQTIEHLRHIWPACSSREDEFLAHLRSVPPAQAVSVLSSWQPMMADSFDRSKCLSVAAALRRSNTSVVPTLSNGRTMFPELRNDARFLARFRYVPRVYHAQMNGPGFTEARAAVFRKSVDVVRVLYEAGVELLAGTDTPPGGTRHLPGFSLHDELSLLAAAGLSPMEAIEAATRKPARRFGKTDVGTIEPGMQADMVMLDQNPLDDIENTRRIAAVMTGGRLLDRAALDEMLADIERKASEWNGTVRPGRPIPK